MDSFLYDITPGERGSAEWLAASQAAAQSFGESCEQNTGPLLAHVDTESTVRDLDALRAAVGDKGLNYLGYSYGTSIGSQYAELFPTKVNRVVLDGAVDPQATNFDANIGQAIGFESALKAYLVDCLTQSECPFSGTVDDAASQVQSLLRSVDVSPIRASDGRQLGSSSLLTAIVYPLYGQENWPYLSEMIASVLDGEADYAFQLADGYNGRDPDGTYSSNETEAFLSINCLEYPPTTDPAVIQQQNAQLLAAAPTIGPWWTYGDILCSVWPVPHARTPAPVKAEGAKPILVVGTTNDPATPYKQAQSLAEQLSSGQLITYVGEGHTAYGTSKCVERIVDDYFLTGAVPASDPRCTE